MTRFVNLRRSYCKYTCVGVGSNIASQQDMIPEGERVCSTVFSLHTAKLTVMLIDSQSCLCLPLTICTYCSIGSPILSQDSVFFYIYVYMIHISSLNLLLHFFHFVRHHFFLLFLLLQQLIKSSFLHTAFAAESAHYCAIFSPLPLFVLC